MTRNNVKMRKTLSATDGICRNHSAVVEHDLDGIAYREVLAVLVGLEKEFDHDLWLNMPI